MFQALVVPRPHVELILAGKRTWEIRGVKTKVEGRIALVASGSGTIVGVCDLVECLGPLTADMFRRNAAKTGMRPSDARFGSYRQAYAWVLAKPKRLKKAVAYRHPFGVTTWVHLDRRVEREVLDQLQTVIQRRKPPPPSEVGTFEVGEIVSIENDDPSWEDETFIGMVVKKDGNRMKVVFAIDTGVTKISWLLRHDEKVPNRWIDKTYAATVHVEEASASQREAFQRWVPIDRQSQLLQSEKP